ncbi:hypothetical protein [Streptomyces prasinus]
MRSDPHGHLKVPLSMLVRAMDSAQAPSLPKLRAQSVACRSTLT